MCDTCEVLQKELSRRRLNSLLSRVYLMQAPADHQFEALKYVNEAELDLGIAEDLWKDHQTEHLEQIIGVTGK